ncbi:MAG: ParB/RepB/Spo0J family partition protein [Kiritimatiellaeota bacterium]|nr:ParB/RepB/Spo0J family partition protein [Kiritimatiellota bacterium]
MDKIIVLNSRNRDKQQFAENVRSINEIGLLKPIVVNGRNAEKNGTYELVCGEGRLLAHQRLEKKEIAAEIIDCDRKTALLYSLVENIARVPPGTMWFAREMKRMHDAGFTFAKIATIVGKHQSYVSDYIKLVNQGEERLIEGVEDGLFSMSFAVQVAQSDDTTIQNVLMDAFDDGLVNCNTVIRVRKLLELRLNRGKSPPRRARTDTEAFNLKDLTREITKATKDKEDFVHETTRKENRLLTLLTGISVLLADSQFLAILKNFDLGTPPQLSGEYGVELQKRVRRASEQTQPESES